MIPDPYPKTPPTAILFDWDNTLINNWTTILSSLNFARQTFDLSPLSTQEFWDIPHHSVKNAAQELFGKNFKEAEKIYYDKVKETHLDNLEVLDGALELFDALRQRDIYTAVVSNKHGELLRKEVDHLGWNHHFGKLVGSLDTAEDKPSPIPVIEALKPAKLDTGHHIWFVGDSIIDVECAQNSGCVPVAVGKSGASKQDNVVKAEDCRGVLRILESLPPLKMTA